MRPWLKTIEPVARAKGDSLSRWGAAGLLLAVVPQVVLAHIGAPEHLAGRVVGDDLAQRPPGVHEQHEAAVAVVADQRGSFGVAELDALDVASGHAEQRDAPL